MRCGFVFSNRSGFTLLELMIVGVVITGLIATLSPTYEKYVLQAKAMEGPVALAGLYTAEQQIMAETGTYVACTFPLGIAPEERGYFVVGFNPLANVGKEFAIVPNCTDSGSGYSQRRTYSTQGEGEQELTVDNPARPDPTKDTVIFPKILLIRGKGAGEYRESFVDNGCTSSTLKDANDKVGTDPSPGVAFNGLYRIGSWRNDSKFIACAQAALSKRTSTSNGSPEFMPTQYTINEKKEVKLINRGF